MMKNQLICFKSLCSTRGNHHYRGDNYHSDNYRGNNRFDTAAGVFDRQFIKEEAALTLWDVMSCVRIGVRILVLSLFVIMSGCSFVESSLLNRSSDSSGANKNDIIKSESSNSGSSNLPSGQSRSFNQPISQQRTKSPNSASDATSKNASSDFKSQSKNQSRDRLKNPQKPPVNTQEDGAAPEVRGTADIARNSAASPDAGLLASLWSQGLPALSELPPSKGHTAEITMLYPLGKGLREGELISADLSGAVLLWNIKAGKAGQLLKIPSNVRELALHENPWLLAAADNNVVHIYSLSERKEVLSIDRVQARISALDFSPDGKALLMGSAESSVWRWKYVDEAKADTIDLREKAFERYVGHSSPVSAVKAHPSGRVFFSGDWRGAFAAWLNYDADPYGAKYDDNYFGERFFLEGSSRVRAAQSEVSAIDHIEMTKDGQLVFLGLQSGTLEVWAVRGLDLLGTFQKAHAGAIYDMKLNESGDALITSGRDGKVKVWGWTIQEATSDKALAYTLVSRKEIPLKDAKKVVFLTPTRALVGTGSGQILELDIEKAEKNNEKK